LRLRGAAGDIYGGNLFIESRTIGMNLVSHPDQQWLEAMVERHAPDVLIMGPLYRLFRALPGHAKHSEETAEAFGDAIDRVRIKHDLAVILEAHAPHGKEGDRADFRPYGASYWLRWPEMGVGLKPRTRWQGRQKVPVPGEFDFVFWRGTRDFDIRRPFPQGVRRSKPWSFACDDEDVL
jgi:replicative DNA helicase